MPSAYRDGHYPPFSFPSEFLAQLGRLSLRHRSRTRSNSPGEAHSRYRGASIEFADHRAYSPGDDLRFLDWNVLARLDRPYTKSFYEEQDLIVEIVIDVSESMGFGHPSKFDTARLIMGGLAWVTLAGHDRTAVHPVRNGIVESGPDGGRPSRGKPASRRILDHIVGLECAGETDLGRACRRLAARSCRSRCIVVISDFFDPGDWRGGLRALAARGHRIFLLQVLSDEEHHPSIDGDLSLVDAETGSAVDVTVDAVLLARYAQALESHSRNLDQLARALGGGFLTVTSAASPLQTVSRVLERIG